MNHLIAAGSATRLGARFDGDGTNFAVFSAHASQMDLCLFSPDGRKETARIALPECTGPVWHGYIPGLKPGALYGFRAHGSYAPDQGHRFNPNKLLLDPYTRELAGRWTNHDATLGYVRKSAKGDLSFDPRDSAPHVPKSVVSDPALLDRLRAHPATDRTEMLIYEAHVKGLTQQHPNVPEALRGTYEGLASDAMLDHLTKLGVTSVELLPVHAFVDDGFLLEKGLVNYWGYNSIGFFAPEPRYFGPAGFAGVRAMVDRFHAAGIEVILDVVYNHTAEGDHRGPTLSFRGLDNASYYRLSHGQPRYYVNDTGCGNTLNVAHPFVLRMVMDSLRFWVEGMGVDGFRFDLATTLGREDNGFDPNGGFLDALRQDPVLAGVHLIAEPWDIGPGGYQLGRFPPGFGEWNDRFRDTSRRYWRGDDHSAQDLAACLLGSAGHFDRGGRRAWSSVNMITAHDGFTLADVTRYAERHNLANLEEGRDGHHANFSDNCGVEGETDDAAILARRQQRQRNLLATMFLAQGTPMVLAGDEIGNSQQGNNNAYCQDNPTGWITWDEGDETLLAFVTRLSAFRRAHPVLRQSRFLHGGERLQDAQADVQWMDLRGRPLQWRDPGLSTFALILRASAEAPGYAVDDDPVFLVFNREDASAKATLPPAPAGRQWVRAIDTAAPEATASVEETPDAAAVAGQSVLAFALTEIPA
ncbi:glycogen debranching protein GlgX [Nioella nitratireducens]|uniref:glycogen debranching protein GlgX n=1 Tax=Nioella nitratireducens TaxID=1287720 RepID=UPI0008FCF828|nr:glycogen debranching protein GlgX [Nioella nitratireducens]